MNIYMNLEIAVRELDSKLLLAVKAAHRGHDVLIGEEKAIDRVRKRFALPPGVYHTKSLTPSRQKLELHGLLKQDGFAITSIDEEGGLIDASYKRFAQQRYSEEMLELTDAVFCWGPQDFNQLGESFPKHRDLLRMTGSPRADLWRLEGKDYSVLPDDLPKKPYLLVSSNFGLLTNYRNFWDLIRFERNAGYFERDPEFERERYYMAADTVIMMYEFIKAIEKLAGEFPNLQIVVRPHPVERPESWEALLDPQYENILITRSGSITPWVHNAVAVMHNGCTTAMEATLARVPVLTYKPVEQQYPREIPNALGVSLTTRTELADAVRKLLRGEHEAEFAPDERALALVKERIWCEQGSFAADNIIDTWEELGPETSNVSTDWERVVRQQQFRQLKSRLRSVFKKKQKKSKGFKFPKTTLEDVKSRIRKIEMAGNLTGKIGVKLLDDNMILVIGIAAA